MRTVFTAVFGKIGDRIRPPTLGVPTSGTRWVCFTDRKDVPKPWERRPPLWQHPKDPRRTARWHKLNAHIALPDTNESLWMDGCLVLVDPPQHLFRYLDRADVATFRHHDRDCVYEEALACKHLKKDDPVLIREQIVRYRDGGYPTEAGLAETTAMVRRHTPEVAALNSLWWEELANGSVRDQLSFDWCCRRLGVNYAHIQGRRERSVHFRFMGHR